MDARQETEPRTFTLRVRLAPSERAKLATLAEQSARTMSDVVRRLLAGAVVVPGIYAPGSLDREGANDER